MSGPHSFKHRAYVALGSNLQDPVAMVCAGMDALADLPATHLDGCSSLYHSAPVGMTAQPDFINAVCRLLTDLGPHALLRHLLAIETQHGRVREGPKWGPRTLDLDLLLYDEIALTTPTLVLPHPGLHERAFVLYPLVELDPGLFVPGHGRVAQLATECPPTRVQRLERECC
jgi:2-amino-4-hydroxy-6-hydroxymethyldihydropteridine diphosphokinase